jgi:DNA polymerase III subunit alpha
MAVYLNECRRMGIQVLPPDVNESDSTFTPVGSDIRFGLSAVRNVGDNVVAGVTAARTEHGKFTDFSDFMEKVPVMVCNKRVIESLVKAGAFDSLGHRRRALVAVHEAAVDQHVDVKRNEAMGQESLFGGLDDDVFGSLTVQVPDLDEWDKQTLLGFEREMLGLYVSSHPLLGLEHVLAAVSDCTIGTLIADESRPDNSPVTVAGLITSVQRKITRKGDTWAIATLEDLEGSVNLLVFPSTYQVAAQLLVEDTLVLAKGRLRRGDDAPDISATEINPVDQARDVGGPIEIALPANRCTPPVVDQLKEVLATHPGAAEVYLRLTTPSTTKVLRLDDRLRVAPTPALMADLKALLGPTCLSTPRA